MSRVQRELLELRAKGLATSQKDKYKDFTAPLTTPEEAQAFLASMRDKMKSSAGKAPPGLSADGMDAWFLQQRQREQETRKKKQEAEAMLRGYRMTMSHDRSTVQKDTKAMEARLAPVRSRLFDKGIGMGSAAETVEDPDSDVYEQKIGRLPIKEESPSPTTASPPRTKGSPEKKIATSPTSTVTTASPNGTIATNNSTPVPPIISEPTIDPAVKQKAMTVPTPAKPLVPDETEWREFVEPVRGARFPSESGRYHLYASFACPGSHRALIVRALKGLEDCVSVTFLHPVWRLTEKGTDKEQRGWVFGSPDGEPFTNTAGRGGPFPPLYEGNEPDPVLGAFSLRELYEHAGDTAAKYTVPLLWDKKENTIVNNESSDIAYMLNSSFNEFAKNPDLDLYTEDDIEKLNDVIEWLSPLMIHGVYRCGFAKSQEAYDKAVTELTEAFDKADETLQRQRYLTGDAITDADIRLFVTLIRFDEVFAFYFRANTRLVVLTPSLLNYCRDIYQMEGVARTCNMEQIKAHFYASHAEWNKFSIVPKGLNFMKLLDEPHNREEVKSEEKPMDSTSS